MADERLRVFSGARPTGRQHLGNYLGARQALLAEPLLERAEQVAGILRSRLKVHGFLAPFRNLAYAARSN